LNRKGAKDAEEEGAIAQIIDTDEYEVEEVL
jgi:hypothetical protein